MLVFLFNTSNVFAFSILQTGNQNIHANGYNDILKINPVYNQGNVKGTMTNTTITADKDDKTKIFGFYDPFRNTAIYNNGF